MAEDGTGIAVDVNSSSSPVKVNLTMSAPSRHTRSAQHRCSPAVGWNTEPNRACKRKYCLHRSRVPLAEQMPAQSERRVTRRQARVVYGLRRPAPRVMRSPGDRFKAAVGAVDIKGGVPRGNCSACIPSSPWREERPSGHAFLIVRLYPSMLTDAAEGHPLAPRGWSP